jgi:Leucine-rich repeat (LRR) protein
LIGAGEIPKEIGNLRSMQKLFLFNNQLEGKIGGHHQLCSCILICNWLGPIPKEIGQLTALENCNLSSNQLSGLVEHHQ